jgi:hypothetical protein
VHVVGDAAYVGRLRDVDDGRITWTSRLKVTSVLHELPPPHTGRSGRPRTRGARLGTPADVAALATTTNTGSAAQVRRYGRTDVVQITERVCLWYGSLRSRTVRVILSATTSPGLEAVTTGAMGSRWSPPIWNPPRKTWWRATHHGGASSRPSPPPARSSAWARPAVGPAAPSNERFPSG